MLGRVHNFLRFVHALGPRQAARKTVVALRRDGLRGIARITRNVWTSLSTHPVPGEPTRDRDDYAEWVRRFDTLSAADLEAMRRDIAGWPRVPVISVLMPTYNPRREWLVAAIESIRNQAYPHWELCIADDASTQPHVREVLQHYVARDRRVRIHLRESNGHISATSNSALSLATGDWLALLDHDDILPAHALYWIAKTAIDSPSVQMVYSDEDKIGASGERFGPYFKPDWNADLFHSQNMFSHLGAFRADLVRAVGGFRIGFEGSQDYDLALRCAERLAPAQIAHVPRILYHWRVHAESTASSNDAKPYAQVAAERALNEHLQRMGWTGSAERTPFGYRVRYPLPDPVPRVGIVVLGSAGRRQQVAALDALLASDYGDLRVYLTNALRRERGDGRIRTVARSSPGQSCIAAIASAIADGCAVLCFVEAGALPTRADWLHEMVGQALRPGIGAVGCRLVDMRGRVLSAGVAWMSSAPVRAADLFAGVPKDAHGIGGRAQLVQRCTAVRASGLAVRTEAYRAVMADDELPDADAGLEVCARLAKRGLGIVWTPHAELQFAHPLPAVPGTARPAAERGDPTYNPNLHAAEADFTLAWPPLVTPLGRRGHLAVS